jgi:hypothetical protein
MKNGSQWRKTLDATDPCWDLFSYKLILNEVRYLTKAVEFLKGAVESNLFPTRDFNELEMDLEVVKGDVEEAKTVLKDTIDMVSCALATTKVDLQFCIHQGSRLCGTFRLQYGIPRNSCRNLSSDDFVDGTCFAKLRAHIRAFLE